MTLDLIIPCYNPRHNWELVIVKAYELFNESISGQTKAGIILVNDGSTENVDAQQLEWLRKNIPEIQIISYVENKGKGYALRQGVALSKADSQIVIDVDFPYLNSSIVDIYASLQAGNHAALGNRDTYYYKRVPFIRKLISKSLRWLIKNILRLPVTDSQCGLKGFQAEGKKAFLACQTNGFLYDLEFVIRLAKAKVKLEPVSVALKKGVIFSQMGFGLLLKESISLLKVLAKT